MFYLTTHSTHVITLLAGVGEWRRTQQPVRSGEALVHRTRLGPVGWPCGEPQRHVAPGNEHILGQNRSAESSQSVRGSVHNLHDLDLVTCSQSEGGERQIQQPGLVAGRGFSSPGTGRVQRVLVWVVRAGQTASGRRQKWITTRWKVNTFLSIVYFAIRQGYGH